MDEWRLKKKVKEFKEKSFKQNIKKKVLNLEKKFLK